MELHKKPEQGILKGLGSQFLGLSKQVCLKKSRFAQWKESFSKHLWIAFVVVFLAEMGRIPCCGRPESSSSNI